MHLLNADVHRIESTIAAFRGLGIRQLGPAHCTGPAPTARLWTEFAGQCESLAVGSRLAFDW
jgi:metal-dependent hydrolase (beta-lactamase superfamily II)